MEKKISDKGKKFIQSLEGLRLETYLDSAGIPTIGYGTTKDIKMGMKISKEKAEILFSHDIIRFERALNELVKVELTQNQIDATISFMYNIGVKNFTNSTFLLLLNEGKLVDAAKQLDRWVYITKGTQKIVSKGLQNRRAREKELFLLKEKEPVFDKVNEFINRYVVRTVIEKVPFLNRIFKLLDGHKTKIGRTGLALTVFLQSLIEFFPQESLTTQGIVFTIGSISWLLTELGIRHSEDKEVRGVDKE